MEWVTKAVEFLKLPLRYIWAVTIASGLLLFLPKPALKTLNVAQFAQDYGSYIGVIFILSLTLAVVNVVVGMSHYFRRKHHTKVFNSQRLEAIQNLDPHEKAVLREFFIQGQNTIYLPIGHPTVAGMRARGLLFVVGDPSEHSLPSSL